MTPDYEWLGCYGYCHGRMPDGGKTKAVGAYCKHPTCVDGRGKRKQWHLACVVGKMRAGPGLVQNGKWECASCKGAFAAGEAAGRAEAEAELKPGVKKTRCDYCGGLFNMKNMARHVQDSCKESINVEGGEKKGLLVVCC